MKIILPEHIGDITLDQYQKFEKLKLRTDLDQHRFDKRMVEIFTELTFHQCKDIPYGELSEIVEQINIAMTFEPEFKNRFFMNGVELGLIPNFDKMSSAEFFDLDKYQKDEEEMHRVMAILYRPITSEGSNGSYQIAPYLGTEDIAEAMRKTPLNIVKGAMVFFSNLANELETYIQKSTAMALQKAK